LQAGTIRETGETNETGENTLFVEKAVRKIYSSPVSRVSSVSPLFSLSLQEWDFEAGRLKLI
jgi:hypothetical protein